MKLKLIFGIGIMIILSIPQVRNSLISTMIGQMIVQIPLLALAGYLIGVGVKDRIEKVIFPYNSFGLPGLLLVLFTSIYWLLPRSLDAALNYATYEALKYVMVPFFIGLPLALSWRRLNATVKGFIWANIISMLFVMGWFYANSPVRLCNNYLNEQQIQLGTTLMGISILFLLTLFYKVFFIGVKNV